MCVGCIAGKGGQAYSDKLSEMYEGNKGYSQESYQG